jgi:diguanylate cyclase (GGDEF)-like protein
MEAASTDPLTGILNRRSFRKFSAAMLDQANPQDWIHAFVIDVDNLKEINDKDGHEAGDRAIEATARAIENSLRSSDLLARFGGDEFVAVITDINEQVAETIKSRIRGALRRASLNHRISFAIEASIGCASQRAGSLHSIDELVKEADQRMYAEKEQRKLMFRRNKALVKFFKPGDRSKRLPRWKSGFFSRPQDR